MTFFSKDRLYALRRNFKELSRLLAFPITLPLSKITRRRNQNNICLIHAGRSGSTLIADMLAQHSEIFWNGKILTQKLYDSNHNKLLSIENVRTLIHDKMKGRLKKFYGIECEMDNFNHLEFSVIEFITLLKELGYDHLVILERKNYLRAVVSRIRARKTGQWHAHEQDRIIDERIRINVRDIFGDETKTELLKTIEAHEEFFKVVEAIAIDNGIKCLKINYEDDLYDQPAKGYNRITDFLALKAETPNIRFRPTSKNSLRELVSNFEELEEYMGNHPANWMLKD